MRFAIFLLGIILFLPTVAGAQEQARQIVVQGQGVVTADPDMAIISLGVTREARTASAAMDAASAATLEVLASIRQAGVAQRDVQTSSVDLSPRWDQSQNGRPILSGYVASNTLSVRVRALDELGSLLDSAVGTGANTTNGLTFTVAEPRRLEDEARALAVRDARARAELLAEAAGVTLGQVVTISEAGVAMPPSPLMRAAAMEQSMAVPVATGEVEYRVSVDVVFDISGQ